MRRIEYLNRRLAIARREAEDADRVWHAAMALDRAYHDEQGAVRTAQRLHAVWEERELARERVAELERRVAAVNQRQSRTPPRQPRPWHSAKAHRGSG